LLHYKARNFPKSLAEEEVPLWEEWRSQRILGQLPSFVKRLQELSATVSEDKQFVLQELQLWAESIVPTDNDWTDSGQNETDQESEKFHHRAGADWILCSRNLSSKIEHGDGLAGVHAIKYQQSWEDEAGSNDEFFHCFDVLEFIGL